MTSVKHLMFSKIKPAIQSKTFIYKFLIFEEAFLNSFLFLFLNSILQAAHIELSDMFICSKFGNSMVF